MNLDRYAAPDLVIEIAKSSLLDDLGGKRSLYESIGVSEYWVVDVKRAEVLAFEILERGSQQIRTSKVLPDFEMMQLEEALRMSREVTQTEVGGWLMQQFQS